MSKLNSKNKRKLYKRLLDRYGNYCYICNKWLLAGDVTIDHIICRGDGGTNEQSNLRLCCIKCNNLKSSVESYICAVDDSRRSDSLIQKICQAYSYYRGVIRHQKEVLNE